MKILIIGANGLLGKAVRNEFEKEELLIPNSKELDITEKVLLTEYIEKEKPDIIINCAAYTNVDKAEEEKEIAYKVNSIGPLNLAQICQDNDILLVHISTDYVMDGKRNINEEYEEDDKKHLFPNTVYGRTKLEGDNNIVRNCSKYYIFRTSWLFGDGKNFIRTILELSKTKKELDIVNDQYGNPTYSVDLAKIIKQTLNKKIPFGIYNATNLGSMTWFELAKDVFELSDISCEVNAISTEKLSRKAIRPKNSKLSVNKLLNEGIEIPAYKKALRRYLDIELSN